MSDVGLDWGPFDIAAIALIIGSPGLVIGAVLGAVLWRRRRLIGALLGAFAGLVLWLAGFVWWKMSPWGDGTAKACVTATARAAIADRP
jgi:Na+/proline symporter